MKKFIPIILVITVTTLLYLPALNNQFNNWDDYVYITSNNQIELNWTNVSNSFLHGETHGMYVPLTALSNSITYHFFKLNPKPYIAINLIIHLCNIVLLFIFLSKILKSSFVPLVVTTIFALHPLNVEVVAYAAGRRDVLFVFFYLLSIIFYIDSITKKRITYYLISIAFAILALLSKGNALTIVATLFIIDLFLGKRFKDKSVWLNKIPFLLLSIITIYKINNAIMYAVGSSGIFTDISFEKTVSITPFQHIIYACTAFMQYIARLIIPYNLSLVHSYPIKDHGYFIPTSYYIYSLSFVLLIFSFIRIARRKRVIAFGILFYVINIVLLLQIIRNSYALTNDHYAYFAGIGIFLVVAEGLNILYNKYKVFTYVLLSVYFVFLGFYSSERIKVFKNSITLWKDVAEKYPNDKTANYNLAVFYDNRQDYDRALLYYSKTINVDPNNTDAAMNRAVIFAKNGNLKDALNDLNVAILIDSSKAKPYMNRGCVLQGLKRFDESINDFNKAISLQPSYDLAFINRAVSKIALNDFKNAVVDCDSAISVNKNPRYYQIRDVASNAMKGTN